ncbi:MAG: V-type ATP synthase subunit F [Candidatus Bathyarchaeia archaeon]
MKVAAIGKKDILVGFMLAGIKERLETDDHDEALKFLQELEERETDFLVIVTSDLYHKLKQEISEIQARKPSFVFYELSGGGLKWTKK